MTMKQYEVLITDAAQEDMEAIYTYIADTLLEPATHSSNITESLTRF